MRVFRFPARYPLHRVGLALALACVVFALWGLHGVVALRRARESAERTLERQRKNAEIQASLARVQPYVHHVNPAESTTAHWLTTLEHKLDVLQPRPDIREIHPEKRRESPPFGLESFQLRVSPVDARALGRLVEQMENTPPRFRIMEVSIERIPDTDTLDISMKVSIIDRMSGGEKKGRFR